MTSEEITQNLQRASVAIEQLTQMAVRADKRQDAADAKQQAGEVWHHDADERIEALINAQVRYEARQEKLEEAFRQVATAHTQVVEMLQRHEERLDSHDEANIHTEARLDALIDAQIQLIERVDTLTRDIAAINGRAAATDERLATLIEAQARTDEQMKRTDEQMRRTDEIVRSLVERNSSTAKPKAKAKKAKKSPKKGVK